MLFFIQAARFYPKDFEKLGFLKKDDGFYIYTKDNSLWKKKLLLDLGYGKENGLVRIFDLCFKQGSAAQGITKKDDSGADASFLLPGLIPYVVELQSIKYPPPECESGIVKLLDSRRIMREHYHFLQR